MAEIWIAMAATMVFALSWTSRQTVKPVVHSGQRVEMFVDEWLVESRRSVSLKMHPPEKREIVLTTDKPWEGPSSAYYTIIQDGSLFRLYYRGFCPKDDSDQQATCYAESKDGIHFTRPNLGLYEFIGSRNNNIVYRGVQSHNFAPFLDTNPATPKTERYKALAGINGKLYAYVSSDGLHWAKLQDDPVMTEGAFDSLNTGFWDEMAHCYRCYSRYWAGGDYKGARAIQSCTSADFKHWSHPVPNHYAATVPVEHFYTNATRPCPGVPTLYLSFPMRFVPDRIKMDGYKEPGLSDAVFMSSRDGVNWDRPFLEPWVAAGLDPRNWTQRSNMPVTGIVQTSPDEFSMYVSEHYEWPDNRVRRLAIRRHGFGSMHASVEGGEFTTRPIIWDGGSLELNYATSAAGSLQVEMQDEWNKPIFGYSLDDMVPLFGDELDRRVVWKSGRRMEDLAGKTIRLRFVMRDADLFALRFGAK